jgi:hypothetical protein
MRGAGSAQCHPKRAARPANNPAVKSSTAGYCHEIRAEQCRHRPRNNSHDTTGMLSRASICVPQLGQADGGVTTDSCRGTL